MNLELLNGASLVRDPLLEDKHGASEPTISQESGHPDLDCKKLPNFIFFCILSVFDLIYS